ncbi:piwi-like protein 1 [Ictalurus furcatus]|uniref:piwi-like protein 1 n=1 Tax=Ictalurus furcatus TaxID=66913 RepID=UPI002350A537|nr:piwi-like protein 1 [Ictalurus furcatus]XP_053475711.1 piwi-like protein 1 [Ictalurus furcatus]XP_053475712.1 piwi-like protein 1 [Ictalurus furcatus]XP_053475713.1 piwi-like protein 1 [Ictalurus furcatus]XP_053475714.1 piwi-like protein 1 [Ictalurus furcatus]XP_053475715.1 piwi-like protein 1 [Ictalurus furcatus]XP_053475716.1 piwi-like protein 1 [Ictalurus furcatus]XP_053475717.1 piwi-like protein 1 [Ictalurus furcatus]XP_053475718.1 piwi-like protein 1 [Ictalurus furcatus]
MKDLSTHTRLTPEQWENRLNRFINNMSRNASVQTTLSTWGLSFENKLLNLTGRVLPVERILQGARAYEYNPCDADWSKEMRGLPLMTSMPQEIWLLSHTRRDADVAHSLLQTLNKVPVGIHLQRPGMMEYDDRRLCSREWGNRFRCCTEGLLQIGRMFAVTHGGVSRWRGRRRAAERSRLQSASVHAVHQGHG